MIKSHQMRMESLGIDILMDTTGFFRCANHVIQSLANVMNRCGIQPGCIEKLAEDMIRQARVANNADH